MRILEHSIKRNFGSSRFGRPFFALALLFRKVHVLLSRIFGEAVVLRPSGGRYPLQALGSAGSKCGFVLLLGSEVAADVLLIAYSTLSTHGSR